MYDLETLLKDIKNPRHQALSALICLFCMFLGYARGSIVGLVILIYKHEEKRKEIKESLIIPKIGLTERKEQWLRKKKLRELKAENRIDMIIKIVWIFPHHLLHTPNR